MTRAFRCPTNTGRHLGDEQLAGGAVACVAREHEAAAVGRNQGTDLAAVLLGERLLAAPTVLSGNGADQQVPAGKLRVAAHEPQVAGAWIEGGMRLPVRARNGGGVPMFD